MTLQEIEEKIELYEQMLEARKDGRVVPSPTGRPLAVELIDLYRQLNEKRRQLRAENE